LLVGSDKNRTPHKHEKQCVKLILWILCIVFCVANGREESLNIHKIEQIRSDAEADAVYRVRQVQKSRVDCDVIREATKRKLSERGRRIQVGYDEGSM
jgi:hypothetical protein